MDNRGAIDAAGFLDVGMLQSAAAEPSSHDDEFEDLSACPLQHAHGGAAIRPLLPSTAAAHGVDEELAMLADLLRGLENEGGDEDAAGSQPHDGAWSPNPADAGAAVRHAHEAAGGRAALPDDEGLRVGVEAALAAVMAKLQRTQ